MLDEKTAALGAATVRDALKIEILKNLRMDGSGRWQKGHEPRALESGVASAWRNLSRYGLATPSIGV